MEERGKQESVIIQISEGHPAIKLSDDGLDEGVKVFRLTYVRMRSLSDHFEYMRNARVPVG